MASPLVSAMQRLLRLGRPHRRLLVLAFGCMAVVALSTGAYAFLAATAAGATFYDDTNLVPNVGYSYRLRSFSGALYSPYSNEAFDVPNN